MQKHKRTQQPRVKWGWILSWLIMQPAAALPLVAMVLKWRPFQAPFVADGSVVLPALLVAVAPVAMLLYGTGITEPVRRGPAN